MYEIEQRELRSRLYLAKFLHLYGFKVLIFQHRMLSWLALVGKPGALFLKSNPYQFDNSIALLAKRGFRIFLWQEEGIHFRSGQTESPVFSSRSVPWIYKYFAWHPVDADFAMRQGFSRERVEICGNTRMELASSITRKFRGSNEPLRILVVSNFDMSTLSYNFVDDGIMQTSSAKESQHEFNLIKAVAPKNFLLYEQLLRKLELAKFTVIYRPYFFEQRMPNYSSYVTLDENPSVFDSLKNSDVVIHYGSTVGVEAVQAGVLSIILSADLTSIDSRISGISLNFSDISELMSKLQSLSENSHEFDSALIAQLAACVNLYKIDFRQSHQSQLILRELRSNISIPAQNFPNFLRVRVIYLEAKNFLGQLKRNLFKGAVKRKAPLLNIERIQTEHSVFTLNSRILKLKYFRRALQIFDN